MADKPEVETDKAEVLLTSLLRTRLFPSRLLICLPAFYKPPFSLFYLSGRSAHLAYVFSKDFKPFSLTRRLRSLDLKVRLVTGYIAFTHIIPRATYNLSSHISGRVHSITTGKLIWSLRIFLLHSTQIGAETSVRIVFVYLAPVLWIPCLLGHPIISFLVESVHPN